MKCNHSLQVAKIIALAAGPNRDTVALYPDVARIRVVKRRDTKYSQEMAARVLCVVEGVLYVHHVVVENNRGVFRRNSVAVGQQQHPAAVRHGYVEMVVRT